MNKFSQTVLAIFLLAILVITTASTAAAQALVSTYRPLGNTYATKPTYSWSKVGSTATYKLQVYDIAAALYKVNVVVPSSFCSATTNRCSFTSNVVLTNGKSYRWRAAAGAGAFSAWKTFVVKLGFNSTFNGNSTGWVVRPGGTWANTAGTIYTTGKANKWSSITYGTTNFNNFTYSARMKRVSTTGGASGFWLRGVPTFAPTFNSVNNAYLFLYSQNGCFSVWKHVGGVVTAKKVWTLSPSIVVNGWNTLKVTADAGVFRFYINNVLVWGGSDTSFATGQVALTMFRTTSERLDVDWATLGMSELYKAAAFSGSEEIEQGQVEILSDLSQPYGPEQAPVVP